MQHSFNPFYRVVESNKNPSSRFYRRTLWEKINDTFFVIAGNTAPVDAVSKNDMRDVIHIGILHYLTLLITPIINDITFWCWRNLSRNPLAWVLIVPASILFLVANAAYLAVAGVLTLIASPIVTLVHIFSQLLGGHALKKEAGKLRGVVHEYTQEMRDDTFNNFLNGSGHSYSDIIMDLTRGQDLPKLLVMENHHKFTCCIESDCRHAKGHIQFEVDLNRLTTDDKVAIRALLQLNAGSLRDNLMDGGYLQQIEEMVAAAP